MAEPVRATVLVEPKTLEAREFARPAISADDALLRIEACGICGSDYEQYEGATPKTEDYTPYPVIPGHEPLGIVEQIGARARQRWDVAEGDRIAVRSGYGCGRCPASWARTWRSTSSATTWSRACARPRAAARRSSSTRRPTRLSRSPTRWPSPCARAASWWPD